MVDSERLHVAAEVVPYAPKGEVKRCCAARLMKHRALLSSPFFRVSNVKPSFLFGDYVGKGVNNNATISYVSLFAFFLCPELG